jgi:hypothetical protein
MLGQRLSRLDGPLQIAAVQRRNAFFPQGVGGSGSLPQTVRIERDIELALDAGFPIPGGLAMSYR